MDKVLKQRLVGATILIALAVIFVPMLFDDGVDRDQARDTVIDLPPPPIDRREVRRLPLDPDRAREVPEPHVAPPPEPVPGQPEREESEISLLAPEPESEPEPPDPVEEPARVAEQVQPPAAQPEPQAESPAAAPTPAAPAAAEVDSAEGWIVQVASFSSADTADRVMEQLGRLGHAAAVDVIVRGESRLHRVRSGPYPDRAAADRAQAQIAATVAGVEPVVMSAPAGLSTPTAAAEGAYSVQVGSFTTRANADRLMEQLRNQGYEAFIHPDEAGPRPIWRVRVGTQATREAAAGLRRELMDQAGLEGLIVSHP